MCNEKQNDLYRNAADEYEADHYALENLDLYMNKALLWIIKRQWQCYEIKINLGVNIDGSSDDGNGIAYLRRTCRDKQIWVIKLWWVEFYNGW